jgi:UDP-N-acetylglucosamine pyrophosphorylase
MPAHRSAKDVGIPLAIMTSDDTHAATLDLLQRNDYFGAKASQAGAYTRSHLCSTWAVFVTETSKAPHHMGQKVLTLS